MKMIAVTQRIDYIDQYQESRDALDQRWHALLMYCGLLPLILPNCVDAAAQLLQKIPVAGFLLTGGNNTPARDDIETNLINIAVADQLPLLGICHGMQKIQRHFNITLEPVHDHICESQTIAIHDQFDTVNSYHELGAFYTAAPLLAWAFAADGVVKAIQHDSLPITGIMWHPERLTPFASRDIQLIKKIFDVRV